MGACHSTYRIVPEATNLPKRTNLPNTNNREKPNKKQMLDFQHFFIVRVENYAHIFCNNHRPQLYEMFEHRD